MAEGITVTLKNITLCGVPIHLDKTVDKDSIWIEFPDGTRQMIWPPRPDDHIVFNPPIKAGE